MIAELPVAATEVRVPEMVLLGVCSVLVEQFVAPLDVVVVPR